VEVVVLADLELLDRLGIVDLELDLAPRGRTLESLVLGAELRVIAALKLHLAAAVLVHIQRGTHHLASNRHINSPFQKRLAPKPRAMNEEARLSGTVVHHAACSCAGIGAAASSSMSLSAMRT